MSNLGRLERVDLRQIWQTEAGDFTPWLASEANISVLSDAIGIELEVEATERNVGPFRADILCKDTATNDWVLVENQLEKTDHIHLGQLMTYAAGLDTVTIVWVAAKMREEHRAALDWLNDITNEAFKFFGLEVELWRIGNSPVAPKFNVVCKPNDWTRSVTGAARQIETSALTETKQLQLEYWTAFHELMEDKNSIVKPIKPRPQNWMTLSIGRTDFLLYVFANSRDKLIGAYIAMLGDDAKTHFKLLAEKASHYDQAFGEPLQWKEMPDKKESHIKIVLEKTDPLNRDDWPRQHFWLFEKVNALSKTFAADIKLLDAEQSSNEG